jgi:TP901 family phage tail tape measure protein
MALNNLGLGFIFTAKNLATGTINRVKGQLGGLGMQSRATGLAMKGGFAIAAGGLASLTVGLGMLGSAFSLAGAAGNFEQQMSLVGTLADASGERLENLRNAAIEAGLATKFSPDEAVQGLKNLITAGLQAEQAAEALTPALQVAEFGMIDVADAGAAVVGSMNAFRNQGLSAQQIADRLATAMARTNFQAEDFAAGLSMVSGTAGMFNQTLDTTLVGMGLLRNMNLGASTSATALREAIRRLGSDQRAQAEAARLIGMEGIFSEDGQGEMRNVIDIIADLQTATQDMTAAQRQQRITTILGSRGLNFFAAVAGAEFRKSLDDGTTQILRGVDAARELERQMESSAGMARRLQQAVSEGNYAGVVNVLKGVGETLMVEVGRPIGEVLVPIVVLLKDVVAGVTRFINKMPNPIKRLGASLFLLTGVLFSGAGAMGIFAGLFAVMIPFIKVFAIVLGSLVAIMAPFVIGVGAMIGAIVLFRQAIILNVGGVKDFLVNTFGRIKLAFDAIVQLFSQGGFSGAIREEMGKAENRGIRRFAISLFAIGSRIIQFFKSIKVGFSRVAEAMGPRFEGMIQAFKDLFEALGFVQGGADILVETRMDTWAEAGARFGGILADTLGFIVDGIRRITTVVTNMINFFVGAWGNISPFFDNLMQEINLLGSEFQALFLELGVNSTDSQSNMMSMGEVFSYILQGIVIGIVSVVRAIVWLTRQFVDLGRTMAKLRATAIDGFTILSIRVKTIFANMVDDIKSAFDQVIAFIGRLIGRIPAGFRPAGLDEVVRSGVEAEARIAGRVEAVANRTAQARTAETTIGTRETRAFEAAARVRTEQRDTQIESVLEAMRIERERDRAESLRPIQINIDGEQVAARVANADRRAGARGFVPVPSDTS